jgi:uncharacterized protein (DUF4213/DUF364 family)
MPTTHGVASRIARALLERDDPAHVSDLRIGLGYTAVTLDDRRGGVAYTFRDEAKSGCSVFRRLRPLAGRHSSELLTFLPSDDPIEAALGLACANALANVRHPGLLDGDVLRHLELRSDDHVGMVGYFGPLIEKLRKSVHTLTVFEGSGHASSGTRPPDEAEDILPECQVALITATSIINHSMDQLLESAAGCREVAVLGASTPLLPEVFLSHNVTLLSGVIVADPLEILRVVSEGGGMRYFGPHVSKVCMRIRE